MRGFEMDSGKFLLTYIKLAGKMEVKTQHYLLAESEEGDRECHSLAVGVARGETGRLSRKGEESRFSTRIKPRSFTPFRMTKAELALSETNGFRMTQLEFSVSL